MNVWDDSDDLRFVDDKRIFSCVPLSLLHSFSSYNFSAFMSTSSVSLCVNGNCRVCVLCVQSKAEQITSNFQGRCLDKTDILYKARTVVISAVPLS